VRPAIQLYRPFLHCQEQFKKNFKIVGVTQYTGSYEYEKNISELKEYQYLRDHYYIKRKLKWPVSITRNDSMDDYGISSFPVYILIDKEGIVRDGYYISNFSYLKKKIEMLLKSWNIFLYFSFIYKIKRIILFLFFNRFIYTNLIKVAMNRYKRFFQISNDDGNSNWLTHLSQCNSGIESDKVLIEKLNKIKLKVSKKSYNPRCINMCKREHVNYNYRWTLTFIL